MSVRGFLAGLAPALLALSAALGSVLPGQAQRPGNPGEFDYYALVLSWSPSYCAAEGAGRNDPQCARSRPYAFVLHGLWPQYARGFPESCRTASNPFVPRPVINGMLDIMPSPNLAIHEYRKHGTCSGLEPKPYFDLARKMFNKINIPEVYRTLDRPVVTPVAELSKAFQAANPGLRPDMMGIACGRPNRMREIRFCFSKEGEFKTCGSNEKQDRLCRSPSVYLPPVRAAAGQGRPSTPAPVPTVAPSGERKI